MTKETNKHDIGLEIIKWLPHDRQYVYALNVWALHEQYITKEEAEQVKLSLDTYYKEDVQETSKSKFMFAIFKKEGYIVTKVLFNLIDQYPKRCVGPLESCEMIPDNEKIMKDHKIPSIEYYKFINILADKKYIEKLKDKKIKINFSYIKEVAEQQEDDKDEDVTE